MDEMMRKFFMIIPFVFLLAVRPPALCQEKSEQETKTLEFPITQESETERGSFYWEFINMLTTLGMIVAVLLIISWLFKKTLQTRMQQINVTSMIKILETRAISTKLSLHLIEVQNKGIVFAESTSGIEKLTEIDLQGQSGKSFKRILEDKIDHPEGSE